MNFNEIAYGNDSSNAVKVRSFWNDDGSDAAFECFCKPIRTPLMNGFFGMNGHNCHPMQKFDK